MTGNTAGGGGGGIYNDGTIHLRGSLVDHNTANGGEGGGIWNKSTASVQFGGMVNNQANNGANGGGIGNDGTLTLSAARVGENTTHGVPCRGFVNGCDGNGGGIYNTGPANVPRDSAKMVRDNHRAVPPPQGGQDVDNCGFSDNQHIILWCGA